MPFYSRSFYWKLSVEHWTFLQQEQMFNILPIAIGINAQCSTLVSLSKTTLTRYLLIFIGARLDIYVVSPSRPGYRQLYRHIGFNQQLWFLFCIDGLTYCKWNQLISYAILFITNNLRFHFTLFDFFVQYPFENTYIKKVHDWRPIIVSRETLFADTKTRENFP